VHSTAGFSSPPELSTHAGRAAEKASTPAISADFTAG
jgi:hypothetical protein